LRQAFSNARMTMAERNRWQVGRVEIDHDWTAYKARWSRKHRQKMAWAARQLTQRGDVRLDVRSRIEPGEVASAMQQCFEIEDRGWKGSAGSSILRTPGMAGFFIRQAQQAARWGQLELVFLDCGDRHVAFTYGLTAKGVFHSTKISYDPEFQDQMPGQLLRYYLLERFFSEPGRKALDFQGEMTDSHAAWQPDCRPVGRLVVAPRRFLGRLAVGAYKHVWPLFRRRG
jgi:CelD/BcsL family acetyltransferase involved in cellulose biosynthesis